ncbi:MAG: hypothetical protein M1831_002584 [Alyxoria varia]|nr:MAG: hypothetical protein M1831_002584 [Alyxoria varia]
MSAPLSLLRLLLPRIPLLLSVTISQILGTSSESAKWTLKTALVVHFLRSLIVESGEKSVADVQGLSVRDPGVPRDVWMREGVVPVGDDDDGGYEGGGDGGGVDSGAAAAAAAENGDHARRRGRGRNSNSDSVSIKTLVFNAIDALKPTGRESYDTTCTPRPVEFEWTAPRKNVAASASGEASAPATTTRTTAEREDQALRTTHLERVMGGRGEFSHAHVSASAPDPATSNALAEEGKAAPASLPPSSPPTTILYFHGGALYLMDPASHRQMVSRLCGAVGPNARAMNVRYRLAPQDPFPAALMDALVAYLGLTYPPRSASSSSSAEVEAGGVRERMGEGEGGRSCNVGRGAEREWDAVDPSRIVFAGDSAGGNLCMALLQLLMHLQRTYGGLDGNNDKSSHSPTFLRFNNHRILLPLPLPAGVALFSPWLDLTRSLPSTRENAHWDYLPPPASSSSPSSASSNPVTTTAASTNSTTRPTTTATTVASPKKKKRKTEPFFHNPGTSLNPTPCALWPRVPPRADIYTEGEMLCHPLVSPMICEANMWRVGGRGSGVGGGKHGKGGGQHTCPPIFCAVGQECLTSEGVQLAQVLDQASARDRELSRREGEGEGEGEGAGKAPPVTLEYYEAMPHAFGGVFPKSKPGVRCSLGAGEFVRRVTGGSADDGRTFRGQRGGGGGGGVDGGGVAGRGGGAREGGSAGGSGVRKFTKIKAKSCEEVPLKLVASHASDEARGELKKVEREEERDGAHEMRVLRHEEVARRMCEGRDERIKMFEGAVGEAGLEP